jgi:divalent metal cation (Fe/Co/Zn/Cd) transporter
MIVMPILFYMKYRTGESINSRSLMADAKQTLACVFLSLALLVGLGMNYLFGVWEADPIVGFIVVTYLIKEGYTTLKEEKLCSC